VRDGARGAQARAAAARADAERAAAAATEAANEAAELLREAQRLSAEVREAEQHAAASARALDSLEPDSTDEPSELHTEDEIDLTDVEPETEAARDRDEVASSSDSNERHGS
jgi:hypothetical protein